MKWIDQRRYIAFLVPGLAVRCAGDEKLWLADPTTRDAWIAAEHPVDLRDYR